jgi:glycosyltransferase involved in cell wall biosynthesis
MPQPTANILYINLYAGAAKYGMEFRPYYLAKEWVKTGNRVTIISGSFSHTRITNPVVHKDLDTEVIDGIKYVWLKVPQYKKINAKRLLSFFIFILKLFWYSRHFAKKEKPEIVVASSTYPLDIFPAFLMARFSGAKLIYEAPDLEPLTLTEVVGLSKFNPFVILLQIAENFAYRRCDKVVSVLANAYEHMKEHHLPEEKYVFIPNGVSMDDWNNPEPLPANHLSVIEELKSKNSFLVGYVGYHGVLNCLDTLIDSAALLKEENIFFIMVGQGPEKKRLMEEAEKQKLDKVIFLDTIKKAAVPEFVKKMDSLFLAFTDSKLYHYGVGTNKLFDYMMSGTPVVQSQNAVNDFVSEGKCGITVPANDPSAVSNAIKKIKAMDESDRVQMGSNGKNFVLENFTYETLAAQYLAEINTADKQ